MTDKRCLVAVCHNWPFVFTKPAQSFMTIGWGDRVPAAREAHGFAGIDFAWECGFPRVDSLRDSIADKAVQDPIGYTHILFLDADMKFPPKLLLEILRHHDKGIVSGHYSLKSGSYPPVALLNGRHIDGSPTMTYDFDTQYRTDGKTDENGLRTVDVVGMGCTLIPLSVFRELPRPWFEYENNADGFPAVSEDVPFCRKAQKAGYRIAWDPSIVCDHAAVNMVSPYWNIAIEDGPLGAALLQAAGAGR